MTMWPAGLTSWVSATSGMWYARARYGAPAPEPNRSGLALTRGEVAGRPEHAPTSRGRCGSEGALARCRTVRVGSAGVINQNGRIGSGVVSVQGGRTGTRQLSAAWPESGCDCREPQRADGGPAGPANQGPRGHAPLGAAQVRDLGSRYRPVRQCARFSLRPRLPTSPLRLSLVEPSRCVLSCRTYRE